MFYTYYTTAETWGNVNKISAGYGRVTVDARFPARYTYTNYIHIYYTYITQEPILCTR